MRYQGVTDALLQRGIDGRPWRYHPTSVEAVIQLAETGHLRLPQERLLVVPKDSAKVIAEIVAMVDYVHGKAPFFGGNEQELDRYALGEAVDRKAQRGELSYRIARERLLAAAPEGFTEDDLDALCREASHPQRLGVLVALPRTAQRLGSIQDADSQEPYIAVPGGLPIRHIKGLDPLGELDYQLLAERIQVLSPK